MRLCDRNTLKETLLGWYSACPPPQRMRVRIHRGASGFVRHLCEHILVSVWRRKAGAGRVRRADHISHQSSQVNCAFYMDVDLTPQLAVLFNHLNMLLLIKWTRVSAVFGKLFFPSTPNNFVENRSENIPPENRDAEA